MDDILSLAGRVLSWLPRLLYHTLLEEALDWVLDLPSLWRGRRERRRR